MLLDKDKAKILATFRYVVNDILRPECDNDDFLLKWLKARSFDVSKAEKMFRKSFKFLYNIDGFDLPNNGYVPTEICVTHLPTAFWGYDNEGSGIRCVLIGLMDFRGYYRSLNLIENIKNVIYLIQTDLKTAKINSEKTGKFSSQIVYVLDFKNFNIRQVLDKLFATRSVHLLQMFLDNLPELMKIVYCINIPPLFELFINLLKPVLDENTFKKLRFFSTDDWVKVMQQHVDLQIIPRYYGGQSDDRSGDPDSFIKRTNGGKIPTERYLRDDSLYLKESDPGMQMTIVPERSSYFHSVHVQKPGTTLKWLFQTKDYNIKFGVQHVKAPLKKQKKPITEELVKVEAIESHTAPERGELLCEKAGLYKLHFDNTYSWTVKKKLLFKVEQEEPISDP